MSSCSRALDIAAVAEAAVHEGKQALLLARREVIHADLGVEAQPMPRYEHPILQVDLFPVTDVTVSHAEFGGESSERHERGAPIGAVAP